MKDIPVEFLCFDALVLGIFVFTIIYNVKVGRNSQPVPWMHRLRQFQNKTEDAGWRIQMIPYDDTAKPMTLSLSSVWSIVPVVGGFGFLIGVDLAFYDHKKYLERGVILAVSSWLVGLGGWWLKNRGVRLDWDVAPARCVDRELRKIQVSGPNVGGGWGWFWRVVCEYEYLGIPYRVTPEVYWANFTSEEAALKFLQERISPKGECTLRVDPENPLRTELLEQGSKD